MRILKKKGFTLIELLAVIVLLGVISIIAIPNIAKLLKDNKQNLYEKQLDVIETAAKLWSIEEENKIFLMTNQSWPYFITISDLKASSFIDGDINNPLTDEPFPESTVINIDYINNNYVFTVDESSIDENSAIIKLNGDKNYNVEVYDDYVDLGATAIDSNNNDLSSNITTEIYQRGLPVSNIDTTILTNYTIKYTVTYTDIDNNYHTAIETRRVNIVDTTAPTLTCTNYSENNINIESSSSIELPEVVVTDNYDSDISIVKIGSISSIIPGNKKLIYVATDNSGNSTSLEFNFIVKDTIAPVITEILVIEDSSNSLNYYKVIATDTGSGIKEYSFDGGKTWQKSNIYYPSGDITGSELVFVKDNAGNIVFRQLVTEIVYDNGTVVYFDVKTGKSCTEADYHADNSTTGYNGINGTGNQTSCLKFYIFGDTKDAEKVSLLLDHNTTARAAWKNTTSNTTGPTTNTNYVLAYLNTATSSWVGTETPTNYTIAQTSAGNYTVNYSTYKARLMTAGEVAAITGSTFTETTSRYSNYFFFDTNTTSASNTCKSGNVTGCEYGWLYDRTSTSCTTYGCLNNASTTTSGFWTATSTYGNTMYAWYVKNDGSLYYATINSSTTAGVRPVIEVLKTKIKINTSGNSGEESGGDTGDNPSVGSTYEITYDCNGGTGSTASSTHTYGVASNLSTNGCYRVIAGTGTGTSASPKVYSFVGWSTSSSATTPTYTDGQSVTDVAESGTVTLYAVWSQMFTYSGKYTVESDSSGNWKVKFLSNGTFKPAVSDDIDVFLVGGGGGGGRYGGGGGGGGYTNTINGVNINSGQSYSIVIGTGGASATGDSAIGSSGTSSSGFGYSAAGGSGGGSRTSSIGRLGGDGGSGGGGGGGTGSAAADGGSNGSEGGNGVDYDGGVGQGAYTREFGDTSGTLYAGGGAGGTAGSSTVYNGGSGGGGKTGQPGSENTGGGGGGSTSSSAVAGSGGSGIVIIRNARNKDIGIDFEYTGHYETIDDGNGNWRIKFFTSGVFTTSTTTNIDVFLVGGGGAGGTYGGGGGGGGKTKTTSGVRANAGTQYTITIGAGGTRVTDAGAIGGSGGTTSGFNSTAAGGSGGGSRTSSIARNGGSGGSGGGAGGGTGTAGAAGGAYGSAGANGASYSGGSGQGTTTCEFGQGTTTRCNSNVTAYSGGGGGATAESTTIYQGGAGGGASTNSSAAPNTGGGGGGANADSLPSGIGGSGIVIIRNAR